MALIITVGGATTVATLLPGYFAGQTPFASLPNPTAVLPVRVGTAVVGWTSTFMLLVQALAVLGLVLRAHHSHGAERRQVKWFVFAAVIVVFTFLPGYWFEPLFVVATLVALPALPVAAGIGVLRYRLYDIDRIVSRTVAYVVLTVLLVGIYLAAVTALTALTSPVTGDSPIAVAAATLLAAAAFGPARRRIQSVVDRRFNRGRYDAVQISHAYRARLRDELELKATGDDLVETVRATMAPTQISMWLRTVQESFR